MNVPKIVMMPCASSQIAAHGHDPATNTLAVSNGGSGSVYHYANVTKDDCTAFVAAKSKGKHFGAHIKSNTKKHPFQKQK